MRKIKPLNWQIDNWNPNPERYRADTWFGSYWSGKSGERYSWHCFDGGGVHKCDSLQKAQVQCWAHYQDIVERLYE